MEGWDAQDLCQAGRRGSLSCKPWAGCWLVWIGSGGDEEKGRPNILFHVYAFHRMFRNRRTEKGSGS